MIRRFTEVAVGMRNAGAAGGGSSYEGSYVSGGTGYGSGYVAPAQPITIDLNRAGSYSAPAQPITLDIT